jgi:Uma2 family endonuclease
MSARIKPQYTLEEYFDLERLSEARYEWFGGEVFCMSGVTPNHGFVEVNLTAAFTNKLDRRCSIFPANIRIKTPAAPPYRYADLSLTCDTPVYENIGGIQVLTNPVLIIEVLSPSTEGYDRGDKFTVIDVGCDHHVATTPPKVMIAATSSLTTNRSRA